MAKANPLQLKRDADAAEKAGRFDKAIEALKQIVQENPRDWNTVNRIGDLYAKLNNFKAANEQYVKVARHWADDGFHLKAIALWKKVLKYDPSDLSGEGEPGRPVRAAGPRGRRQAGATARSSTSTSSATASARPATSCGAWPSSTPRT